MSGVDVMTLHEYDVYGFDIDHTLAKYNIPDLFETVYTALASYLVENKNYDKSLLKPFDRDFCTRGLILDVIHGNILKLGEDGTVLRASHGTSKMDDKDIISTYGDKRHWNKFDELIEKVNNIDGCRIFENFFDMPGIVLAARIVDMVDKRGEVPESYEAYWSDVVNAFNETYHPKQFALEKGKFFPLWKKDRNKYLEECSEDIREWLRSLRKGNKKTFIMTSSKSDFATASLEYIFGKDWKSYFDLYITRARKPGFFTENRYFLNIVDHEEREPIHVLEENGIYAQGNLETMMKCLSKMTGKENPKVLYFGDSIRSDVRPAKKFANWTTVMILEEMVAERHDIVSGSNGQDDENGAPKAKRKRGNTEGPSELEKDYLTSQRWGSLFTDENLNCITKKNGFRPMNTLWGYIIRKYCDIAVPTLNYLADLPLDAELQVFNHDETYQWGFHPRVPGALTCDKSDS